MRVPFYKRPEFWYTLAISVLFAVVLFFTFQYVNPAPSSKLRLATGSDGGFYDRLGQLYGSKLTDAGLDITLKSSKGTRDNIDLLKDTSEDGVDVAFVQGGVANPEDKENLVALASIALEPLWIFTRKNGRPLTRLDQLKGATVAVGPDGSGTRALALLLFNEAVDQQDHPTFSPLSGPAASDALKTGEIEAAMFVTAPTTAYIQTMLSDPTIELVNLERVDALQQKLSFLSKIPVPEGALSLSQNLPPEDIVLLAPATTLVAKEDVHPAVISLVLDVANDIHQPESTFGMVGKFPSKDYTDFPLSPEARRYFAYGPSFLRRYLPFWAANLIERLWVLIIPLITIIIPIMRVAPPAYRWQIRRRIYIWYASLREFEERWWVSEDEAEKREIVAEIDRIRDEVNQLKIPVAYSDELYHLRMHIAFVKAMMEDGVRRA